MPEEKRSCSITDDPEERNIPICSEREMEMHHQ